MINYKENVKDFHYKFGLPIIFKPRIPSTKRKELREQLIKEEYLELSKALEADDIVEIADGAADLIYVVIGTCIEYGIDIDKVWQEVHYANIQKVGGKKRGDGKILKPEGWKPPRIKEVLGL